MTVLELPALEDRLQARLVDGRAIHFHLQFVEPVLRRRGRLGRPGSRPAAAQGPAVSDALRILEELGLRFFVDLVVPPAVDAADAGGPELPARLLRSAAEAWIRSWMESEGAEGAPDALAPDLAELASEYGSAVVHEFVRRWGDPGAAPGGGRRPCPVGPPPLRRLPSEVLGWLDSLPGVPLAKELFCCWYPFWRRTAFIVDSPFDHLVELRPGWDGGRPFTEVLELHRRGLLAVAGA